MANPLDKYGISDADIANEIATNAQVRAARRKLAGDFVAAAKRNTPVDTGESAAAWEVVNDGERVVWDADIANILEYGTNDTPEFAVMARTAAEFGGTFDGDGA